MGKVVDITERLSFEERPRLKIKDQEIEVRNDAATVLQMMDIIGDGSNVDVKDMLALAGLAFPDSSKKIIEEMKLNLEDYGAVIRAAVSLITSEDEDDEGNEESHITT